MGSLASEYRTFFYNLLRFGIRPSKEEVKQLLITAAIIAFVWSFNKWGEDVFDPLVGIGNVLIGFVFGLLGLIINQIGQRIVATYYGYDPVFEWGILGLMTGVIVTFASRGLLIFFVPGAINLRHLTASRLGEFRYYTNDWEWAKAGFFGPFLNIVVATLCAFFKDVPIIRQFMVINIMFAIYSMLPLPGNIGMYLFFPHLYWWSFILGFVVLSSLSMFFINPLITIVLGFVGGAVFMWAHYVKIDKNW